MFELKLRIDSEKSKWRIANENVDEFINTENTPILMRTVDEVYEVLKGDLQIIRVKSENLSLTDKYEFFRFLPITRSNIILVLAIPEEMNIESFLCFISNHIHKVHFIRFFYQYHSPQENDLTSDDDVLFFKAILYFHDQNSADNFYYEFNAKCYPNNSFEFLYCVFVNKIYIQAYADNVPFTFNFNEKSEIFCCPLCLEKLDASSTGIRTLISLLPNERWKIYKKNCRVCSKMNNTNLSTQVCMKCQQNSSPSHSIWCCMICGFTGCDRYKIGHAVEHFNTTFHRYSIDLNSQRIWDYIADTWVHRLINVTKQTEENTISNSTILIENDVNSKSEENLSSKDFLMRIENIMSEYNYVLNTQLEEQRKFYEKEMTKINESNETKIKSQISTLTAIRDEIMNKKKVIESNKKFHKECLKKLSQQDKKIKEMKENIDLNCELIKNVKEDIEREKKKTGGSEKEGVSIISSSFNDKISVRLLKKAQLEKELEECYAKLSNNDTKK